jgi:hypothetical protein
MIRHKEVAVYTNEYYDLDYDPAKNQINLKVKGFWRSVDVVPNYEKDWSAVIAQAKKPGFNVLSDLTEMKSPPQNVEELHAKAQKKVVAAGVHKIAEVTASALVDMSVQHIGKRSGMIQMTSNFSDEASAQAWLDSS